MKDVFKKLKEALFCKVDDVVLDLQTGQVGVKIKNTEGEQIVTLGKKEANGKHKLVTHPLTDLAFPIPAYAFRTQPDQLKQGDIVVLTDDAYGFYHSKVEDEDVANPVFRVINAKTGRTMEVTLGENLLLGNSGVLAVRNIFGVGGPGAGPGGDGGGFPWWMLLLDKGGDGLKDNKLLLLMLMQNGGNLFGGGGAAPGGQGFPWWLLLLGGDEEDGENPLQTIMLMQAMGGAGGAAGGLGNLAPLVLSGLFGKKE